VGFFGPGELLPAFEQAVAHLSIGEVSPVVQVPTGFMVIQRLE
jgi:parvulin-like peptidyl-prolyl isomerase